MAEGSSTPKEFLECGLCYENDDLKRLPCSPGHVYCVTCLTKDTAETQIVQCPQCRTVFEEGVDSIPSAGDHLLDKFLCCDVCIRKEDKLKLAQIYCVVCKKKFCDTHMQAHNMSLDDHERITMTEYQKEYRRLEMRFCAQHTQNIYIVGCQSCCKAFCVECMIKPGNCSDGSSHDLMPLEGLTQELIKMINEKKVWIFDREESLLGIIKQLTRIISDWDTETEEMITKLHEARDKHIDEIRSKYETLEVKLVEMRERSKTEVNQFLDDEVGVNLNKLTRQVKILDNRIYTHHQVDVLESYKETERLVDELINMKIPEYKASDNSVILADKEIDTEIKLVFIQNTTPLVTNPQPLLLPDIKLPTTMELLREVDVSGNPVSLCHHNGVTYIGLNQEGNLQMLTGNAQLQVFGEKLSGPVSGVSVFQNELYVLVDGNPSRVEVHDWDGKLLRQWNVSSPQCSKICIVDRKVIVPDDVNKRLTVYSLRGEVIKHISCPLNPGGWCAMTSTIESSVIVSNLSPGKVMRVSLATGEIMWSTTHIPNPMGVVCYKDKYVLVSAYDYNYNYDAECEIWMLDIKTGEELGVLTGEGSTSGAYRFDMAIVDDTLIVANHTFHKLQYYGLS